jgi:hypothetical protein
MKSLSSSSARGWTREPESKKVLSPGRSPLGFEGGKLAAQSSHQLGRLVTQIWWNYIGERSFTHILDES